MLPKKATLVLTQLALILLAVGKAMRIATIVATCCAFALIAAAVGGVFKPAAYTMAAGR
jgi:hypothetical protein